MTDDEPKKTPTRLRTLRAVAANCIVASLLIVFVLPGLLETLFADRSADFGEVLPTHVESHLGYIEGHLLEEEFDGYAFYQVLAPQFDIIALSHMAAGVMNLIVADSSMADELAAMTAELVRRGLDVAPYEDGPKGTNGLANHNLYHSHLNLILGVHRYVSGDRSYDELHERITLHLRERSLADGDYHAISYDDFYVGKWPADQAVTLASLDLFDRLNDTNLAREPIQGWLAEMEERSDHVLGLHHSAIYEEIWYAEIPRGCALSWTIFYMAQFAPEEARELYENYRESFAGFVLGWGGFREWPIAENHSMNINSGPVIFGLGMAATGLGLAPARLFEDDVVYTGILRSASTFGLPSQGIIGHRRHRTSPMIGEAMLFSGATARKWFGELPEEPLPEKNLPFPTGALLLVLIVLGALGWISRRLWLNESRFN